MEEILLLDLAKDISKPPADMMTRITGPFDALATSDTRVPCWPGRRRETLSLLSVAELQLQIITIKRGATFIINSDLYKLLMNS
jgi:hypothetical protein